MRAERGVRVFKLPYNHSQTQITNIRRILSKIMRNSSPVWDISMLKRLIQCIMRA